MANGPLTSYGDELPTGWSLCGGQYTIERYLNSGGFGITYAARDSLGRKVVIKECFPGALCCRADKIVRPRSRSNEAEFDAILELFEKEATALAALQHPFIVGVHQFFRDNGTAYMAMDFIEGETLLDVVENDPDRLGPDAIKKLLIEVLEAVGYIHEHNILHRDLSPDNIMIDADNLPVLIDFGAARQDATRVSRALSKVLTVKDGYSPQEFYHAGSDQDYSSDLYALAATFYHVVSRTAPPSSHSRMAAAARDLPDPLVPLEGFAGYDAYFIDAINACLSIFPADRLPSASAWRDRIDLERRQKRALAEAELDQELEARIARLVQEFRAEWAQQRAKATGPVDHGPTDAEIQAAKDAAKRKGMSDYARALSSPDLLDPEDRPEGAEVELGLCATGDANAKPVPKKVLPRKLTAAEVAARARAAQTQSDRPAMSAMPALDPALAPARPARGARADRPLLVPTSPPEVETASPDPKVEP